MGAGPASRKRALAALCGAAAAAWGLLLAPALGSTDAGSCGTENPGVETLARTAKLRVYSFKAEGQQVYACGPGLRRPVRIGPSRHGDHILFAHIYRPLALRGYTVAATENHTEGTDFGSTWIRLVQVRRHDLAGCEVGGWGNLERARVRKLLVTPNRNAVWASTDSLERNRVTLAVCNRYSETTTLDEDPGLQIDSVALDGPVLHWTDSSGEHSQRIG